MGTGFLSGRQSGRDVKPTTHLHLVMRLINGPILLFMLYAFMVWTGTALPLPLPLLVRAYIYRLFILLLLLLMPTRTEVLN